MSFLYISSFMTGISEYDGIGVILHLPVYTLFLPMKNLVKQESSLILNFKAAIEPGRRRGGGYPISLCHT